MGPGHVYFNQKRYILHFLNNLSAVEDELVAIKNKMVIILLTLVINEMQTRIRKYISSRIDSVTVGHLTLG